MPNQTIPITLTPGVPPADAKWVTLAELITLVCSNVAGSIRADITFIPLVTNTPVAYEGPLIFNVGSRAFMTWDIGSGAYVTMTENVVGDIKDSFNGNDDVARGWIVMNGRLISDVSGLSAQQTANLQTLFGVLSTSRLPNVSATHTSGLPVGNAFGSIPWPASINPAVTPASGVISPDLPFTNPVTGAEGQALADNTETLRTSVQDSFDVTKQIQAVAQQMLTALNQSSNPPIYAAVFVGYYS